MEKMNNLRDLLKHELTDLRSAEDQITAALPKMIENAKNAKLKQSLQQHLKVTEQQIRRLDKIDELMKGGNGTESEGGESKGLFAGLFGGGGHKCKGMEGIVTEGEKIMKEDMDPDVKDAAIIASCQKVEHYEICGYGTARAFARELRLTDVERLLTETLNEEYEADDLLTQLAVVGGLNEEAKARKNRRGSSGQGNSGGGRSKSAGKSASKGGSKSASKSGSKSASKGGSKSASKSSGGRSKSASKASGRSKSASKTASKGGRSKAASKGGSKSASKGSSRSKTASKGSKSASKSSGRSKGASKKGGKKSAAKGRR